LTGEIVLPTVGSLSLAQPESISLIGTPQVGIAANGGDVTLTFDGSPAENDYVLVAGGHGSGAATLDNPGSGYTRIWWTDGAAAEWGVWYKKLGATPDASVVCDGGGNTNDGVVYMSWVLRGVHPNVFEDVPYTLASGSSTNPNCASITPVTVGAWVFALAASANNDGSVSTPLGGYTNFITDNAVESAPITAAGARSAPWSSGAEDPPEFRTWVTGDWSALTLAVKPNDYSPTLKVDHGPETDTGALVIDEQTPTIPGVVSPGTKAVALGVAGSNPTVIHDRVAIPDKDDLVIAEQTPIRSVGQVVLPDKDTLTLGVAGSEPDAVVANVREPSNDALALGVVGSDPTAVVANVREPGTDALVIDEQDADRSVTGGNPTPDTIGLTLSGKTPDLGAPVIEVPTGAINIWKYIGLKLDGKPPNLVTSHVAAPDKDTLTLGEQTPTVDIAVTVSAGSIAISEKTPVRVVSRIASPATGALNILGLAYLTADVPTGSLTITEQGTSLRGVMEPGTAALTIDEQTPDPDYEQSPDPTTKAVALAGKVPSAIQAHLTLPLLGTLEFDSAPPNTFPLGSVVPDRRPVSLTGLLPTAYVTGQVSVTLGTLTIAEKTPTVDISVYPGTASLVLFSTVFAENPTTGSIALEGQPASIFLRTGTLIENPNATTSVPNNYEICDYTGFKQMPGSLKMTYDTHKTS
jgi:hypothetical protein